MTRIGTRLESIERLVQISSDEVLEKLVKYDERNAVFESHVTSHINNIVQLVKHSLDASTNTKEIVNNKLLSVEQLVTSARDKAQHQMQSMTSTLNTIVVSIQVCV